MNKQKKDNKFLPDTKEVIILYIVLHVLNKIYVTCMTCINRKFSSPLIEPKCVHKYNHWQATTCINNQTVILQDKVNSKII